MESKVIKLHALADFLKELPDQWIKIIHDVNSEFGSDRYIIHFFPPEMIHDGVPVLRPVPVGSAGADGTQMVKSLQQEMTGAQAHEMGYTGDLCPMCQGVRVRRTGTCLFCETCQKSIGGCS